MKILFINPPSPDGQIYIRDINRSGRLSREGTIWPQTSLAMLAAVFPDDDVAIFDCIAEEIGYKTLFERMKEFAPEWVVFNPVSSTITHDMIVSHYGKTLGAKTVAISPHTKALREESLERYPTLDFAVDYTKGGTEPEYNLRELIKGIPKEGTRFEEIPPARQDLLPIHRYNLPFIGRGYTFVVTSRGCPWKCIYCRQNVMNENKVRYRPVDTVIEEIAKYGLMNIAFHADTATMNRNWMMEFCKKVPKGVRWICNSRVDTVDYEMLKEMKSAGCWMVCYGIESGDDDVLAANRKDATVRQSYDAVRWAKKAGLKVWGYFMLGMYRDTAASMDRTIKLSKSLSLDIVNYSLSAPYPGTEWGDIVFKEGWIKNKDWESYDQNYSAQVEQPECSQELVRQYQRKAYREWYFSTRGVKFFFNAFRPEYVSQLWRMAVNHLKI